MGATVSGRPPEMGHGGRPPEDLAERMAQVEAPEATGVDQLEELYARQESFLNEVFDRYPERWYGRMDKLKEQVLMLVAEAMELVESTPWKRHRVDWGRDLTPEETSHAREEVIDVLHFVFNICLLLGMSAEDIYVMYVAKNDVNRERLRRND